VSDVPSGIVLARDRDLVGRRNEIWIRRGLFLLLPLVTVLALLNVFGQRPATIGASVQAASLKVQAPERVRGGLIYQARFTIGARQELKDARLVLGHGWFESMSINSIEPQPLTQASENGSVSLGLGHIRAGDSYVLWIYFQTNPTNVGRRSAPVTLFDGSRRLLTVHRSVTVFP
jgi:hypothetical protein